MALPVLDDRADVVYHRPQRRMKIAFEVTGAGLVNDDFVIITGERFVRLSL